MKEIKICGKNACWAVFNKNREYIAKVYIEESLVKEFSKLLKYCAFSKIAYKIVEPHDLEKLTSTVHHEGICMMVEDHYNIDEKQLCSLLKDDNCVLFLDSVNNPYNVASILRTCANFGVKAILGKGNMPGINPSLARVAEGGIEHVALFRSIEVIRVLNLLKKDGYKVVCSSSHFGKDLYKVKLPKKCIFVLGNEANGVSKIFRDLSDLEVRIPTTDNVESLNVGVSAAILINEYNRSVSG